MHVYLRTAYTFISYSALYKEKAKKNLWNFTESLEGQHSIRYAVYLQYTAKYAGDVLQKDANPSYGEFVVLFPFGFSVVFVLYASLGGQLDIALQKC